MIYPRVSGWKSSWSIHLKICPIFSNITNFFSKKIGVNSLNSSASSVSSTSSASSASAPNLEYCIDHPALKIPDHPLQYRVIGVIQGIYEPLPDVLTKGTLKTIEGEEFEAVLLAKTISAVKNHVDLTQKHNWVVYPHTMPDTDDIHFQIAGLYHPANNNSIEPLPNNYFSIRGDVLYSKYKQKIVVQVLDNNFYNRRKARSFKLELKGKIPDNHIKHFFSLGACLENKTIVVKDYADLGFIGMNFH